MPATLRLMAQSAARFDLEMAVCNGDARVEGYYKMATLDTDTVDTDSIVLESFRLCLWMVPCSPSRG